MHINWCHDKYCSYMSEQSFTLEHTNVCTHTHKFKHTCVMYTHTQHSKHALKQTHTHTINVCLTLFDWRAPYSPGRSWPVVTNSKHSVFDTTDVWQHSVHSTSKPRLWKLWSKGDWQHCLSWFIIRALCSLLAQPASRDQNCKVRVTESAVSIDS